MKRALAFLLVIALALLSLSLPMKVQPKKPEQPEPGPEQIQPVPAAPAIAPDPEPELDDGPVLELMASMSLTEKIEQMLIPEIRTWNGGDMTELNDTLREYLSAHCYGGVILFSQNLHDAAQTVKLTNDLQSVSRIPLLIAADQEGGSITRLSFGTKNVGNMALGAIGTAEAAKASAEIIGSEMNALGLNIDLAPVMDLNINPSNPIIGLRSFSSDPERAGTAGRGYIEGLHENSVLAAIKHYPGHGDTDTDSHTGLPSISKTRSELLEGELKSFKAGIEAGADIVMTAHIEYPLIETETYTSASGSEIYLPATMSRTLITDILRTELGFEGVVMTDAMDMDAVSANFTRADAARLTINAGVDMLLVPFTLHSESDLAYADEYTAMIAEMVNSGEISADRIDEAVYRILLMKMLNNLSAGERSAEYAEHLVGSEEHYSSQIELGIMAVTPYRGGENLPAGGKVTMIGFSSAETKIMQSISDNLGLGATVLNYDVASGNTMLSAAKNSDYTITVSSVNNQSDLSGKHCAFIDRIIKNAHAGGGKVIVISAALPYDAARYPDADCILLCYGEQNLSPALSVSLGHGTPQGSCPVDIPGLDDSYRFTEEFIYTKHR